MNRLCPAETRLKEGAETHTTQTKQVGVFPCRGWVAPCRRACRSIKDYRSDVKLKHKSAVLQVKLDQITPKALANCSPGLERSDNREICNPTMNWNPVQGSPTA